MLYLYSNSVKSENEDKTQIGIEVLQEIIDLHPSRPQAYIALWSYYNFHKTECT